MIFKTNMVIEKIAVIDTETNWNDRVMSIGIIVASALDFSIVDKRYYIITPDYKIGGMFSSTMNLMQNKENIMKRSEVIEKIKSLLRSHNVTKIFAYNASFDYRHLPELSCYCWYDIMKIAANKNYNRRIPAYLECYKNGKLKRGYGVESMYRILTGKMGYSESHNALKDAEDELQILKMLNISIGVYLINSAIN